MITLVRLPFARPDHSQPAEWSVEEDDQLARAVDDAARRFDAAQLDAGRSASAVAALAGGSGWAPRDWEAVAAAMTGSDGVRRTLVECCNRWTRLCYERILAPAAAAAAAASSAAVPPLPSPSAERRTADARALALHALHSSPIAASAMFQRPTSSASPPLASSASSLLHAAVAPVPVATAAGDATGAAPPAALLLSVPGPGVSLDSADSLELPPLELITSTGSLSHSRSQLLAPLSTRSHAHTQQQQLTPRPLPPPVQAPSAQLLHSQLEESVELPSLEVVLAASAAQLPLTQTGDESPSGDSTGPLPLPPLHRGESGRSLASASLPYDS